MPRTGIPLRDVQILDHTRRPRAAAKGLRLLGRPDGLRVSVDRAEVELGGVTLVTTDPASVRRLDCYCDRGATPVDLS